MQVLESMYLNQMKFFGSIGEQAFQTFFICLAVLSDCLKILKAGASILLKKSYGLDLSFLLTTTKNQIWEMKDQFWTFKASYYAQTKLMLPPLIMTQSQLSRVDFF